jgi:hypothetical protein
MAGAITISTLNNDTGVLATQNGMTGIAKAWVNFAGASGTINGSFNVSSVTRNSTGNYTVNYTTAMPNANYCATFNNANNARYTWFDTFTTTSLNCYCFDTGYRDVTLNCVAVLSS